MINLRSDTVTQPTETMRQAMAAAEVGDDFYGDDPTANALAARTAELLGKEAALFTPSGTMANALAVLAWDCLPERVLMDQEAHILKREMQPSSPLAHLRPVLTSSATGCVLAEDVERWAADLEDGENPRALVCQENTHTWRGGIVLPLEPQAAAYRAAAARGVRVHLDGARLFNAAVVAARPLSELAAASDSAMLSLCKGLGAPAGAMLAGPADFIRRARALRTQLGGTIRQVGILAAAALAAFDAGFDHFKEDHKRAHRLAEGLAAMHPELVDASKVVTNIIMLHPACVGLSGEDFVAQAKANGILLSLLGPNTVRMVTHRDISDAAIDAALEAVQKGLAE